MAEHPPVASLPMYDWPEVQWAHDALWTVIAERLRARGIAAPETLDRARPAEEVWRDPGLVLSQTCGWPYVTRLGDSVRLVATPIYDAEGCEGPRYSSVVIARRSERGERLRDFAGRRFGFNSLDSLSGYIGLVTEMRAEGLDPDETEWIETGSHRGSVRAVAEGAADAAAIDAVCWAMAERFDPDATRRLKAIARTPLRPALPFIAAGSRSDEEMAAIRAAFAEALETPESGPVRAALSLSGIAIVDQSEYGLLRDLGGSVQRLFGALGKPPRSLALSEIDEVIEEAVTREHR